MAACPFCMRIKNQEYEQALGDAAVVRFEPLNPVTEGHMLFVPVAHVRSARESPVITMMAVRSACEWGSWQDEDFNIITSSGEAATQTIKHLHIHFVPRRKGDGLKLPWTNQKKTS